ncbi:MAG: hypothetical protein ACPL2E_08110, partial [Conexivisphaera sp.]
MNGMDAIGRSCVAYAAIADGGAIPVGARKVAKLGGRYAIYLPKHLNDLWKLLHDRRLKIRVYLYPRGEFDDMLRGSGAIAPFAVKITAAGDRFLLYLPTALGPAWDAMRAKGVDVD